MPFCMINSGICSIATDRQASRRTQQHKCFMCNGKVGFTGHHVEKGGLGMEQDKLYKICITNIKVDPQKKTWDDSDLTSPNNYKLTAFVNWMEYFKYEHTRYIL
ncbi:hypothetical protein MAR_020698 [Mya arenaria]|uniref:Uncharacterized protein n=1 Tax=Mya arenaria TaxID=6604 RepID=A0ABY7EA89_MYAAR|nr:hypothetical protein MAR_020698 [Mya arenaria]